MENIQFNVGNLTFTYRLTPEQRKLALLTDVAEIAIEQWPRFSETLTEAIHAAIPDSRKIPTQKQIRYVQTIAKDLNLTLPDNYQDSALVCVEFFVEHKPKHDRLLAVYNNIAGNLLSNTN
ncbi:hypothetical protein [Shewanella marina]|uniref:hypothetical protein n=1 Tax=Shewanella marina TaxID=487319 RepID=UPI000472A1F7|nr:hypothetical protein [Shewanella marina]